jgi:CheY-like chemotaxis protein
MAEESGSNRIPEKAQPSSSPSRDKPGLASPRKLTLLLAEDNLPDALLVREVIRAQNLPLEVHLVSDGEQAVEFIARSDEDESAPRPQLLLLDLNLPKMEGFEVLQRLRDSRRSKAIPVLVVTSSDSAADRAQAAKLGAYYFQKPPSYEGFLKLGEVLKQLLADHHML